jgi:hypothetical protein
LQFGIEKMSHEKQIKIEVSMRRATSSLGNAGVFCLRHLIFFPLSPCSV